MKHIVLQNLKKTLTLEDLKVEKMPPNYFNDYPEIESLFLQLRELRTLNYNDFKDLKNVKHLKLDLKNLKYINKRVFDQLNNLEQLEINVPSLLHLAKNQFATLNFLKHLTVNLSSSIDFPAELINRNHFLNHLELSTWLEHIPPFTFQHLIHLETLKLNDLSSKKYYYIQLYFPQFQDLINLKSFSISNHSFHDFNHKWFTFLPNLIRLKINHSRINRFEFIRHLKQLEFLDLSYNRISTYPNLKKTPSRLKFLNLTWNCNVKSCTAKYFFPNLNHLVSLNLYNCKLSRLALVLPKNNQLNFLVISLHSLVNINSCAFKNLTELNTLQLNNGCLAVIDVNTFADLYNLEILDLSKNVLKSLPNNVFQNLKKLKTLNLSFNLLEVFETFWLGFSVHHSLLYIDLSFNYLKIVKFASVFPNLKYFKMTTNSVSILTPNIFDKLPQLTLLNLSNNTSLHALNSKFFDSLTNLITLSITHCNLKQLTGDIFKQLKVLKFLDLSYNKIEKLPANLLEFNVHLNSLHLNNNEITAIPNQFFRYLHKLEIVDLSQNEIKEMYHCWSFDLIALKLFITDAKFMRHRFNFQPKLQLFIKN